MKYREFPWWAGLSAGLVASLAAPTAQAFERSKTPSGVGVSWARRAITFHLNERGSTDVDFDALENTVKSAFQVWSEPDCTDLSFTYAGPTGIVGVPGSLAAGVRHAGRRRVPSRALGLPPARVAIGHGVPGHVRVEAWQRARCRPG